ncbi:MAG: GDSL-type esterase/lipase family protein [Thermoguttaceae bacterium]|nr:GDSL-type esterase/lipase family protein [Thermoguttaceae bacterium]
MTPSSSGVRLSVAAALVILWAAPPVSVAAIVRDSIVAHWDFEDGTATPLVTDRSGNGFNGSRVGAIIDVDRAVGQYAALFDGGDDVVNIAKLYASDLFPEDDFTFVAWIKPKSAGEGAYGRIFNSEGAGWRVYLDGHSGDRQHQAQATYVKYTGDEFLIGTGKHSIDYNNGAGTWQHVAFTIGPANADGYVVAKSYLDGQLRISDSSRKKVTRDGMTSAQLGNSYAMNRTFNGWIDEVAIIQGVLSDREIRDFVDNYGGNVQTFSGPFVPNSDLVLCGPYDAPETGTANWRAGQPTEFLTRKQKHRIRQNGEIEAIRLYLANGAPSEFKLRVWRENQSGTFDMVGTSADLASSFDSGAGFYTIALPDPVAVQEGDYIGYYLGATSAAIFHAQHGGSPPGYSYLLRGNLEGAQGVDFVNGYATGDRYAGHLTIETYMRAPSFVFIGDSIIQGATAHTSYLMDTIESAPETTIAYQFSQLSGYTYQNMGIGSQTSAMIAARFEHDVVALKPRAAVIMAGANDLGQGVSPEDYVANMTAMLDLCEENDILPVVVKILPATGRSDDKWLLCESYNAALETLLAEYEQAVLVDASTYVGQERAGGPVGNLWDLIPAYNVDGVHLNQAGHAMVALAIYRALIPEPSTSTLLLLATVGLFTRRPRRSSGCPV